MCGKEGWGDPVVWGAGKAGGGALQVGGTRGGALRVAGPQGFIASGRIPHQAAR